MWTVLYSKFCLSSSFWKLFGHCCKHAGDGQICLEKHKQGPLPRFCLSVLEWSFWFHALLLAMWKVGLSTMRLWRPHLSIARTRKLTGRWYFNRRSGRKVITTWAHHSAIWLTEMGCIGALTTHGSMDGRRSFFSYTFNVIFIGVLCSHCTIITNTMLLYSKLSSSFWFMKRSMVLWKNHINYYI